MCRRRPMLLTLSFVPLLFIGQYRHPDGIQSGFDRGNLEHSRKLFKRRCYAPRCLSARRRSQTMNPMTTNAGMLNKEYQTTTAIP